MNKNTILDYQEFINQFKFPISGYQNPIEYIDGNLGFSVLKEYGNGYASLLAIFISKKDLVSGHEKCFPLTITANYGKKTEAGLTYSSSSEKIRKLFDPVGLISTDEFYHYPSTNKFSYRRFIFGISDIEPKDIIDKIDCLHTKPTRPFVGLWLRLKIIFWRLLITNMLKFISKILVFMLYLFSGTQFTGDIWSRIIFPDRLEEENKSSSTFDDKRTIDFFGYKASAWAITVYCFVHFIIYVLFFYYNLKPNFVKIIIENSFITIIYVVVTLTIFDVALPKFLKYMIKKIDGLFHITSYKRIRI